MVTKIVGHFGTVDVKSSSKSSAKAVQMANKLADQREAEQPKVATVVHTAPDNSPER